MIEVVCLSVCLSVWRFFFITMNWKCESMSSKCDLEQRKMNGNTEILNGGPKERTFKKVGHPRNHYTTVKMAPCKVCGGKSTGYHFGVVSCEACKAFFRRAIAKESYGKHVCQKGNDCANQPRRINSCCACRLRRCVESGMSKNGVRRGRYSVELRTKSILDAQTIENESRKLESKTLNESSQNLSANENISPRRSGDIIPGSSGSQKSTTSLPVKNSSILKSSDVQFSSNGIRAGIVDQNDRSIKTLSEGHSFCQSSDCASERGYAVLEHIQPTPDSGSGCSFSNNVLQTLNLMTEPYLDIDSVDETNIEDPSMNSISPSDDEQHMDVMIQTLVKLQCALYPHHKVTDDILQKQKIIEKEHQQREEALLFMFGTTEYASSHDFKEVLSEVNIELDDRLVRFREKARATEKSIVNYIYHSKFIPGFKQLDKDDVAKLLKVTYNEFWLFSNFATINEGTGVAGGADVVLNGHKKVIKTFFPKDYVDDVFAFAQTLQKLNLSLTEVVLIRVILLTLIDRCTLKEPLKVGNLNHLFINCLRYHLRKTTSDPGRRFYRIFDRLIAVRTLTHKNSYTNKKFLKEWGFLMNDFPLWREMMSSSASQSS